MPLQRGPPPPQAGNVPPPELQPSLSNSTSTLDSSISIPFHGLHIDEDRKPEHSETGIYNQDCLPDWGDPLGERVETTMDENVLQERVVTKDNEHRDENNSGDTTGPRPLPVQRPFLPHRTSSFSKRHASFDTPREVPLPYMPSHPHHFAFTSNPSHALSQANSIGQDGEPNPRVGALSLDGAVDSVYPVFETQGEGGSSSTDSLSSGPSSSSSSSGQISSFVATSPIQSTDMPPPSYSEVSDLYASCSHSQPNSPSASQWVENTSALSSSSNPVTVWARPLSLPEPSRSGPPRIYSPTPRRPSAMPDRNSTASLPLPSHTPYHLLPHFCDSVQEDVEISDSSAQASSSRVPSLPYRTTSPGLPSTPNSRYGRSVSYGFNRDYDRDISPPPSPRRLREYNLSPVVSDSSSHRERSFPPPQPPIVLTPPPPPLSQDSSRHAPHEPFLAHSPAPQDSYLAVETSPREYRLVARLPGFRRDAITLSTRKRRILHVVADSWEPNGGHFERRISFGYDADLAQVRAEFDGELLRVIVPRRTIPLTYWGSRF